MDKDYTTEMIARDATAFAASDFGKHYLDRLEKAHERCMTAVMNVELSDSYRANMASKASAVSAELEYFEIAKSIINNPKLLQRLRDKLNKKEEKAADIRL